LVFEFKVYDVTIGIIKDTTMQKSPVMIPAALALSLAFYWTAHAQMPANQSPRVIEISAKKYDFTPNEIHVKRGEKVELEVHSEDETHGVKLDVYPEGTKDKSAPGLVFDQPGQNGKVSKGVDQIVDFTAQQPGTYEFKCAKICGMGHGKMKGELVVDP
jgi:heme/copper-type cytochrome/quinol oxidase subunit 2